MSETIFPFSAIVGQERMKLALILNAINPAIGGVLIRGEKGTAKSTAARSLAALLPEIEVVTGCPYSCEPESSFAGCDFCATEQRRTVERQVRLVELPVSATEEAVVGTLDIEAAIREGSRRFEPGLLASAHRGILYIDEVNLLNDHVVDVLLDSAAMGRNFVEREGISFSHPAQFLLIGTMNPEEGDLRPQFIDRFGLAVEIDHIRDAERRADVVRRRIAYESDSPKFQSGWMDIESLERQRIADAKELLPSVTVEDGILTFIARLCAEHEVDGLRADIVIYKAAQTLAAYEGRTSVIPDDVLRVAEMALLHRMRRQPFDDPDMNTERLQEMAQDILNSTPPESTPPDMGDVTPPEAPPNEDQQQDGADEDVFGIGESFQVKPLNLDALDRRARASHGRRTVSRVRDHRGRYVGATLPEGKVTDLAVDATVRAASPFQVRRSAYTDGNLALNVEPWDLRQKVRESRVGNLVVFLVDSSGSMGAQQRMVAAKGAVISLLMDAYQRRDRVAMIAFRGTQSEVVLPPTGSPKLAQQRLDNLPTGGRTPLAQALADAQRLIKLQKLRSPDTPPLLTIVSDCRANVGMSGSGDPYDDALRICEELRQEKVHSIVLDPAPRSNRFGLVERIADALGGEYIPLNELRAEAIRAAVRRAQDAEV
ncbi:MAG: magnesium chelatase subunit D family protein [Chloroflexi bacterium]|nr:magnesium chelatase subunit D family protein [Chloroflexota bacterium]